MKTVFKVMGIILLIPILLIIALITILSLMPMVPTRYTKEVATGGELEAKYLAMGNYKAKKVQKDGSELTKKFYVYYPEELPEKNQKYPVIVVLNGTGVLPKKYKAIFQHLASWGFVVIGNDDGSTGFGKSADETMDFILAENSNPNGVFYQKMDLENIGITGHSQGGAGVFTAISIMEHKDQYKTAVALSPTHEETAHGFGWNYDLTQITIPTLMLAGTEGEFETQAVIPFEKMEQMYEKIVAPKAMLRRSGAEHGQMLYEADGYVTAWLLWQLQGDIEAEKAFVGEQPEIRNNKFYQDEKIDLE